MKKILTTIAALVCLFLTVSLAACGNVDEKVNEATAPLNDEIARLEAELSDLEDEIAGLEEEITDLNGLIEELEDENESLETNEAELEAEKSALEADKAKLESDKAELVAELEVKELEIKCAKGLHVWNGEGEVSYAWSTNYSYCKAFFECKNCNESVTVQTEDIAVDNEAKEIIASFGDAAPSTSASVIYFASASFNSDSEGYDEEAGIFNITDEEPLVLTFDGINFDRIDEENDYVLAICVNDNWYAIEYVYDSVYGITALSDNRITVTITRQFAESMDNAGEVTAFALFTKGTSIFAYNTEITLTVRVEEATYEPDIDSEGYTLVSTAEELEEASKSDEKIRFCADIETEGGFDFVNDTVIDLAGYDLKITDESLSAFWVYGTCVLWDSVGGSTVYNDITVNGTLKIYGAIVLEATAETISLSGTIDLTEYTGAEIHLYVYQNATGIILPDGYAMYNRSGELVPDLAAAKGCGDIYIRATQQENDPEGPTVDSDGYTQVSNAEELAAALLNGGKIRLTANIESEKSFMAWADATVDFAGYNITITEGVQKVFIVGAIFELTDSVGGTEINTGINVNSGSLKVSGYITFSDTAMINLFVNCSIDLSDYSGGELNLYIDSEAGDVILSESYSLYDVSGNPISDSAAKNGIYYVYVGPRATEVATAEELETALLNGGHILFTEDITLDASIYTTKDVFINLANHTLTLTNDSSLSLHSTNAFVKNGTVTAFGYNPAIMTYTDKLLIVNCTLRSSEYIALYCCDGVVTVKNSHLIGGVEVTNAYTDVAIVYMSENNALEVGESVGITVTGKGVLVVSFDPSDMLNEHYNEGVVTDNGDGTFTVKVN